VHLVAADAQVDQFVVSPAAERDVDKRAARPLEAADRLFTGPAFGVFGLDSRDDVAAAESGFVCRLILEH